MNGEANGHDQRLDAQAQSVGQFALHGLVVELLEVLHRGVDEGEAAPLAEIATELTRKLKEGTPIAPSDVDHLYELLRTAIAAAPQDVGEYTINAAELRRDWLIACDSNWDNDHDEPRMGWLPAGRVALFAGTPGRGKSRLALQLALAVCTNGTRNWVDGATGLRFLPDPMERAPPVFYVSWEDELEEISRRLRALDAWEAARGVLRFCDLAAHGALWANGGLTEAGQYVRKRCEKLNARLLVLDPLSAAFDGNENDRSYVRAFMSNWDAWGRQARCAILLVSHPPKTPASSRSAPPYSGSTDWHGAARTVWALDHVNPPDKGSYADEKPALVLTCFKSNYGLPPPRLWLVIDDRGVITSTAPPQWELARLAAKQPKEAEGRYDGA